MQRLGLGVCDSSAGKLTAVQAASIVDLEQRCGALRRTSSWLSSQATLQEGFLLVSSRPRAQGQII